MWQSLSSSEVWKEKKISSSELELEERLKELMDGLKGQIR